MLNFRECCFKNTPPNGKRLIWEITHTCNFNCDYCFQEKKRKRNNLRTPNEADIASITSKLKELNVTDVLITGGEIYHSQNSIDYICKCLNESKVPYSFSTAFIHDYQFIKKLISLSPKTLNISFDPWIKDTTQYTKEIESIELLLNYAKIYKVNVKITGVINKNNMITFDSYIEIILNFLNRYSNLASVYLTNPYEIGYIKNDLRALTSDLEKITQKDQIKGISNISLVNFPMFNMPLQRCNAGAKYIHLEPNGNIYPCHLFANFSKDEYCMGNIYQVSPDRISKNLESFANQADGAITDYKLENQTCAKCKTNHQCNGGCLAEIIALNMIEPQFVCKLIPPPKKIIINRFPDQMIANFRGSDRDLLTTEIDQIENHVKTNLRKNHQHDLAHGFDHMLCVVKLARFIAKKENADLRIVSAAAYFHDFAPRKNLIFESHTKQSADSAVEFLKKIGFSDSDIQQIHHCIDTSSYGSSELGYVPMSIEAAVVRDADWLEAIGARGIARVFAFGSAHECEILGEVDWDLNLPAPENRKMSRFGPDPSPIYHFSSKLLKIKAKVSTKIGKEIAEIRHKRLLEFLSNYKKEMEENSFLN